MWVSLRDFRRLTRPRRVRRRPTCAVACAALRAARTVPASRARARGARVVSLANQLLALAQNAPWTSLAVKIAIIVIVVQEPLASIAPRVRGAGVSDRSTGPRTGTVLAVWRRRRTSRGLQGRIARASGDEENDIEHANGAHLAGRLRAVQDWSKPEFESELQYWLRGPCATISRDTLELVLPHSESESGFQVGVRRLRATRRPRTWRPRARRPRRRRRRRRGGARESCV